MTHKDVFQSSRTDGSVRRASTVLVFAHDRATGAALGALLTGQPGHRVHQAETLEGALEIATTVRIHLIVLAPTEHDRGLAHLRALLGSDRKRRVPIVVAVRDPQGSNDLEFLGAGADDVVCGDSDHEFLVRVERRLTHERERETQAMARRYSLAGDLTGLSLTDLITVLEQGGLTGSLELLTRRGSASLLLRRGQIKYVMFGSMRGRVAFFELLREREGQFEFTPGEWLATDRSAAVEGPNTALMLEGSQAIDENPDEAPAAVVNPTAPKPQRVVPALPPDPELAEKWLRVLGDAAARGRFQLLAREQIREWTSLPLGGKRLRLALVTDPKCGVHIVSHLAEPLALDEIAHSLRHSPAALGFTWNLPSGQSLEILMLDQERVRGAVDVVLGSPAVLILAPSYGDFLTCGVTARAALQQLLRATPPLAILGVGNKALEEQLKTFLKLAKLDFPVRCLTGSVWKSDVTPRALIETAIRQWAELHGVPRSRAAA